MVTVKETMHSGHATELARNAASSGARMVVAAGGDGTIAEVAQGVAGSCTSLGVIPLGTANVLAHELGLPFRPLRWRPHWHLVARSRIGREWLKPSPATACLCK